MIEKDWKYRTTYVPAVKMYATFEGVTLDEHDLVVAVDVYTSKIRRYHPHGELSDSTRNRFDEILVTHHVPKTLGPDGYIEDPEDIVSFAGFVYKTEHKGE